MSHLDDIANKVNKNGSHDESWTVITNAIFRGANAEDLIKKLAKENNIIVQFDYKGHPVNSPIRHVRFYRVR